MIRSQLGLLKGLPELSLQLFLLIASDITNLPEIAVLHRYHALECAYVILELIPLSLESPQGLQPLIIVNGELIDEQLVLLLEYLEVLLELEALADLFLERALVLIVSLP